MPQPRHQRWVAGVSYSGSYAGIMPLALEDDGVELVCVGIAGVELDRAPDKEFVLLRRGEDQQRAVLVFGWLGELRADGAGGRELR